MRYIDRETPVTRVFAYAKVALASYLTVRRFIALRVVEIVKEGRAQG